MHKMPTRKDFEDFTTILNGDKELTEKDKKYLEEWYLEDYEKKSLNNIFDKDDKKAFDYYFKLANLCIMYSMDFKNTIIKLMMLEVEKMEFDEKDLPSIIKNYYNKVVDRFNEIVSGQGYRDALLEGNVNHMVLETVNNSFEVAERIIMSESVTIRMPLKEHAFISTSEEFNTSRKASFADSFTKKKSFARMISNTHGLKPIMENGNLFFSTKDDKLINLALTRGLIAGYIKRSIIATINKRSVIPKLNKILKSLRDINEDGSLGKKIDEVQKIINFIEWGHQHKNIIEYFDIAKYMDLSDDELRLFALKTYSNSDKPSDSLKTNIKKLIESDAHDIEIGRLIEIEDDYDRMLLLGTEETST